MSEQAPRRRPDQLTHQITCQILACEFDLQTNSKEVFESFGYIVQQSDQEFPVSRRYRYSVSHDEGRYLLAEGDVHLNHEISRSRILETLSTRMHRHAFEALPLHCRIHAASGFAGERFFILCGEKYSGKSTLSLKLLYEGFCMVGDELVMLHDSKAVTFPRKMYLRHDSLDLVPEFQPIAEDLPFVFNERNAKMFAFDPLIIGRPWLIRPSPLAAIVYIEPDHGGRSRVRTSGKLEMTQHILTQSNAPLSPAVNWIGEITSAINQAETYILEFGDLDSAVAGLRKSLFS